MAKYVRHDWTSVLVLDEIEFNVLTDALLDIFESNDVWLQDDHNVKRKVLVQIMDELEIR